MPSRKSVGFVGLVRKELSEIAVSRSWLFVALAAGPLVAHGYATALESYAEASGVPGGAAALTQALSPLDGFVSPVFGAYALIAMLLMPFVAIRTVAAERESGAHALMLQGPHRLGTIVNAKLVALMIAWVVLWTPGIVALMLWSLNGGHLATAETVGVLVGHFIRGAFVASLGIACAAITESGASAAVLALAVTLGGWALDFTAAVRGGVVASLARFTPDSALRTFERGDIQLNVVVVSLVVTSTFLLVAMVCLEPARHRFLRLVLVAAIVVELVALAVPAAMLRATWDASEDRRNSFARADEAALRSITQPVRITVNLGPEDPRREELDRSVLKKLVRVLPDAQVEYPAQSSTGLFAGAGSGYGEIWYQVGANRELNRSSVEVIVLGTIYKLAGKTEPNREESTYRGYPLRAEATAAALAVLGVGWPLLVVFGWVAFRRRAIP